MKRPRIVEATLYPPLIVCALFLLSAPFVSGGSYLVIAGLVAFLVALAGMVLVGLPVLLLLNRYGAAKWWIVTLMGFPVPASLMGYDNLSTALYSGFIGALVAFIAWMIGFFRLRDKEASVAG
jgi:hypothetical protein